MSDLVIAISADRGIPKSHLEQLSVQTGLPLATPKILADYFLHINTDCLELIKVDKDAKKPSKNKLSISVDFIAGKTQHRRLHGGGKGQDIAKAIGLHKITEPSVLDLSTGMAGDAFVLASLGAKMTMLERNSIVHALVKDALERASLVLDPDLQDVLSRMTLVKTEATTYLNALNESDYPDVIYFDPMFPERSKSAQVKKEMQFFHDIVGADEDSESILLSAVNKAHKRIVVKRPRLAPLLTEQIQPAFDIVGKSTRYDVYLPIKS